MTEQPPIPARKLHVAMVGAGLSGAVAGRALAEAGCRVTVLEVRPHVAGNCHTERCPETGVMVHVYGPHIFHTDDAQVWEYVNRFATMMPYHHRVRATAQDQVYALPVNLHTINQFFGQTLRPDAARAFVAERSQDNADPQNFEEQALQMIGRELYEAFFQGYTTKQWGCSPRALPAAILKRLPLRFNYDDSYFAHRFQGMPRDGYTDMVARILDHSGITLHLNTPFVAADADAFDHVFWSGPLDGWFDHDIGHLGYRTLDFERFTAPGDWQGCAVMNYTDADMPFTRITEHKHFAPWEAHEKSVLYREYSRACGPGDIPYYPIRLVAEQALLARYVARAQALSGVTFMGRLGSYRYLDMDVTIREALNTAGMFLRQTHAGTPMPGFAVSPL
ncbi:UDP-galactopyranose/dTDP-fucopyranose mutase family protein [Roseicitreum antarcticum]|nr:UDP-galactopyranose mutase [Roseicitreum antarcticum]